MASINDALNNLFRYSIIIRNNTKRDRYVKAAAAVGSSPFDESFDISHVEHKFPALGRKHDRWLINRLGRAITQRRQYLKYCREHHNKLTKETWEGIQPAPYKAILSQEPIRLMPSTRSDYSKPTR